MSSVRAGFLVFVIFLQFYGVTWAVINFAIQLGNPFILCPNNGTNNTYMCGDGQKHYFCVEGAKNRSCKSLKLLKLSPRLRDIFINSHNGLRNKIAGEFRIANMKLVYWSPELELMSLMFLRKCKVGMDTCAVIGEMALRVGQTYSYGKPKRTGIWPGYVVRSWYLEMGTEIKTPETFHKKYAAEYLKMPNFTQISWPPLEFFGCASARMDHMQHIVCFYYPKAEPRRIRRVLIKGRPCSQCQDRYHCSTIYESLCGVDIDNKSSRISEWQYTNIVGIILVFLFLQLK